MAQLNATELQLLLSGPAGKPPPGVLPNFVNPPTLNTASVSAMTVELVLTTLFVSMRMYTKAFLMRSLWYEDCKYNPDEGNKVAHYIRYDHRRMGRASQITRL